MTTLNSDAKDVCNPGYDLIGNDHRKCTAIWNDQKADYDYSWAPPLSVICKPNGKPIPKVDWVFIHKCFCDFSYYQRKTLYG